MAHGDGGTALTQAYSNVSSTLNYDTFTNYWPYYPQYIYSYPYFQPPDKGRQAFQIAKALADKKIVEPKTVKDFIDLVEIIWNTL